jgi:hypothetical protein
MAQSVQTIELLSDYKGCPVVIEALTASGSTVVPGDLVEFNAAGEVLEHSTADGVAEKLIALPNLPTAGTIDDAYTAGVTARFGAFHSGQEVLMTLADSQTATRLTPLVSNGDGTLKITTVDATTLAGAIVGFPIEPVTTSGATARIKVRII